MELLFEIDSQLFLVINHLPHTAILDWFMLTVSGVGSFGVVWVAIAIIMFLREEERDHRFFIPIITALASSLIVAEYIIKPLVARARPDALIGAIIVDAVNNGYSFPSSHAALAFAGAVILSAYEKRLRCWLFGLAILIAISRIYLGKHYPSDVLAGAIIGFAIAKLALIIHHPIIERHLAKKAKETKKRHKLV